jgi:hypothetical protein
MTDLFTPSDGDEDPEAESLMEQGRGEENDLRDPYLLTEEGHDWLRDNAAGGEIDDHR